MKLIDPRTVSINAAIASGDAFRSHAETFWRLVGKHAGEADRAAAENIGELVASATLLALSVELYLKALLLVQGQPAPMLHDLHELFDRLPSKVRQAVEADYDARRAHENPEDTSGVSVHIVREGGVPPSFERPLGFPSMKIRPLLKRNANAFATWRYLFAHGSTKAGEPLSFEYIRLNYAAAAVREVALKEQARAAGVA